MFIRKKIINNSAINLAHWKMSNFSKDVSIVNVKIKETGC